jgi:hypothetical protein
MERVSTKMSLIAAQTASHGLDVVGHARDQASAADGHEDGIEVRAAELLQLAQHLHGNRALAGDHVGVVEGVDEGQPLVLLQLDRVLVGIGVAFAGQHDFAAQRLHGIDLDLRRGGRHHDHGAAAQLACPQGHALCMVAGRGADHALLQLLGRQVRHLVVGAAQLEAEHGLLVLALEQHLVVQAAAQCLGGLQVRLHGHVVHARGEDLGQVVGRGQGVVHRRRKAGVQQAGAGLPGAGGHHRRLRRMLQCSVLGTPGATKPKKSPRPQSRGLNPPIEEVEETNGAMQCEDASQSAVHLKRFG